VFQRLVDGRDHVGRLSQPDQVTASPRHRDFCNVAMLFNREDDLALEVVTQNLVSLVRPDSTSSRTRELFHTAGQHTLLSLSSLLAQPGSLVLCLAAAFSPQRRRSGLSHAAHDCGMGLMEAPVQQLVLYSALVGARMRISSLYFATVRRVTWMPCDWRMRVICSSVNGLVDLLLR